MDIKIIVAAHKKYQMPKDDMYIPVHVGASGKEFIGFQRDDEGDNISEANARLCELTAVFWAWKNISADYIGLTHYRRHFTTKKIKHWISKNKFDLVITQEELRIILRKIDIILPKPRKYYIESIYSHFIHLPYTYEKDIKILREVINELHPDYLKTFDIVMNRNQAHMFNMFIMKKEYFDKYCEWLFSILLEVDRRIDISSYSTMEARAVAYFGEFLINVWIEKGNLNYEELSVLYMERQNWFLKCGRFLCRKLGQYK